MAEAVAFFGAIQVTTQLTEQAFRILERLRKAYVRHKALSDVLSRHEGELRSVKTLIGIIEDEKDLQTPNIAFEFARLRDVQTLLTKLFLDLDPKLKSKANQYAHQLTNGSSDEKKLATIMADLSQVKSALLLRITAANVGVMRNMEKQLVANTIIIERIDESLRDGIDNYEGLRIAQLIKGRSPSNDDNITLTAADLRCLSKEYDGEDSGEETVVDDSETLMHGVSTETERIILKNTARNRALQINAAVGKDIWKEVRRLVIQGNIAEDEAVQINNGIELDVALKFLDIQESRLGLPPRRVERKRHDSVLES